MADTAAPHWSATYRYDARPIVSAPDCRDCRHRCQFHGAEFCNKADAYLDHIGWPAHTCDDFEAVPEIEEAE